VAAFDPVVIVSARMDGNGKRTSCDSANFEDARRDMVARQIRERGIRSAGVLAAMGTVSRHLFVPIERIDDAYCDAALPIGEGQTISQPYVVAACAEALALKGHERVLEIGAGTGYQAAVLSLLAREVVTIEAISALADSARERLTRLGYSNARVEHGDGSLGFPGGAPFDAILVSAAAPSVPQPLIDQLADGGRLIIPVGQTDHQQMLRIVREGNRTTEQKLFACRFVPLVGRFGWQ